ncbi:MAG TPA: tagatose 1,6-diphosphate aldolase [Patescibacteria group bacterium]|nr:tagatose 1,6-diphosphate aldolase [Patescibacteria group bacterium]
MVYLLGTRRGLAACASARGTFAVLALDHRQNLRRELHPGRPETTTFAEMVAFKQAVVRALAGFATGTLLDPEIGAAQCIADGSLPAAAGLIVAIEATGYEGSAAARVSRVLPGWSVEQAKRMGASAAKLLVYYHPDAANAADQEQLVADVAAACRAADLPLFVEPLGFDPAAGGRLTGEARRRCVVETARRLMGRGGDILKAEFPYDPGVTDEAAWADACAELEAASPVPWVLLSGGVDDATFERQVATACRAGASGVLVGRSVWAPSATMPSAERDAWLASVGRARLARLVALVDEAGVPWPARRGTLAAAEAPGEGWYRDY